MRLLYFRGEGQGWMEGIQEYLVFVDDDDEDAAEEYSAPGFELMSDTLLTDVLPDHLPTNTTLVPRT